MAREVCWLMHVVPAGEEHTTAGLESWCCPLLHEPDPEIEEALTHDDAAARVARGELVLVTHRSEIPGANNVTGPVPWQYWAR